MYFCYLFYMLWKYMLTDFIHRNQIIVTTNELKVFCVKNCLNKDFLKTSLETFELLFFISKVFRN